MLSQKTQAILLATLVLIIDALTKAWVHNSLPHVSEVPHIYPYGGIAVFQNFFGIECSISHMTNTGAAWGAFSAYPNLLLAFRILMIAGLIYLVLRPQNESTNGLNSGHSQQIPIALIAAGALGNVIDTLVYHHVVDMFQFKFWGYQYPWFNVADSSIFIGVVWLALLSLKKDKDGAHRASPST